MIYLDTNVMLWLGNRDRKKISRRAQTLLEKEELLISPMVVLELEFMHEIGRSKLSSRDLVAKFARELNFSVCTIPYLDVVEAALDEKWTRDPFDRTIVAQAKANSFARLLTADETIARHYPRAVW